MNTQNQNEHLGLWVAFRAMCSKPRLITGLLALGLGIGCGGQQQQVEVKPPEPKVTQVKVGNISPIDLAVCFPKTPGALPERINKSSLTGLLVSTQPLVMECLVEAKSRGPEDITEFTVESTLEGGKLTHKVVGKNLTPDGEKCIIGAVDKYITSAPDWAAKATATTASVTAKSFPFQHNAVTMPAVKMGTSEASDVAGTIRLAQSTFCDCYGGWKESEPGELKASIKVKKSAPPAVTFEASTDAASTQVAACLQPKVAALPMKTTSDEITAPYLFYFVNSMGTGLFANAKPAMAFMQYDAMRTQYFAASLIAEGGRIVAAENYEAYVQKYKKDPKSVTIKQLQDSCDGLLKGHDEYVSTLEKQLALEEKAVTMLTDFAAKDESWAPVKDATAQLPGQTKKDIDTAKAARTEDNAICAKLKI